MKCKRFVAAICAMSMVFSMGCFAHAATPVTTADMELSAFAGSVKPCIIVESFSDGRPDIIHELAVPIPAMATKETEKCLVAAAVDEATGMAGTSSYRATQAATNGVSPGGVTYPGDVLFSEDGPFNFASLPITLRVAKGELQEDYSILYVTFADMMPGAGASKFHIEVGNDNHTGGSVYKSQSIVIGINGTTTIWMKHGTTHGDGVLRLRDGDNITVWAAVDEGSFFVNNVVVSLTR